MNMRRVDRQDAFLRTLSNKVLEAAQSETRMSRDKFYFTFGSEVLGYLGSDQIDRRALSIVREVCADVVGFTENVQERKRLLMQLVFETYLTHGLNSIFTG